MSFTVTTTMPLISPAVSPMIFQMDVSVASYMTLDIYVGDATKTQLEGDLRTLKLTGNSATVDIQKHVQSFFTSDASGVPQLKRIDIKAHCTSIGTQDISVNNFYIFNGVNRGNYIQTDYLFNGSTNAKFLNDYDAPIYIHKDDKDIILYFLHGIFTNTGARYDVSTAGFHISNNGTTPKNYKTTLNINPSIYAFNICPSTLNNLINDLSINANTLYYIINPSKNTTTISKKTIYINDKDARYDYARVKWIDSNGVINAFNFDLLQTNTIEVDKQVYINNRVIKQINTTAKDVYTITSNWITEAESLALKNLWYSPSVVINGEYVILRNKTQDIMKRNTSRLINYIAEYELANEYLVQKY